MKKNTNQSQLTEKQLKSIASYRKVGIDIKLKGETIYIRQEKLYNGLILNQKELHSRARKIFDTGHIKAMVYELNPNDITCEWIVAKMEEFGIKRNDIIKQIGFDKSSLSLYLSGERGMTKSTKATFFYYFLAYQLNRDIRD